MSILETGGAGLHRQPLRGRPSFPAASTLWWWTTCPKATVRPSKADASMWAMGDRVFLEDVFRRGTH